MLAATSCPLPSTLTKLGRGEGSTHPDRDLGASWLSISGLCLRRSICLNVRQAHHCPVMHPVVQTPTERVYGRKTPSCHKKLPGAVAENQGRKKDTAVSLPILMFGKGCLGRGPFHTTHRSLPSRNSWRNHSQQLLTKLQIEDHKHSQKLGLFLRQR